MVDESIITTTTTAISATITSPPSATKPRKEKINFSENEIDVLVSWSKEEVLFKCKHADYNKKDASNAATLRILKNLNKEGKPNFLLPPNVM